MLDYYLTEFALDRSILCEHDDASWQQLVAQNPNRAKADGFYVPNAYEAHCLTSSPYLDCTKVHELEGHGRFYEHSLLGQVFSTAQPTKELVDEFVRLQPIVEGYALWVESKLAPQSLFEQKVQTYCTQHQQFLHMYKQVEEQFGVAGVHAASTFPRVNAEKYAKDILSTRYGLTDMNVALHFGSKKPASDIDVMIAGDVPTHSVNNEWLDLYAFSATDYEHRVRSLDPAVLDPLFTGTPLFGTDATVKHYQQIALSAQITPSVLAFSKGVIEDMDRRLAQGVECKTTLQRHKTICQNHLHALHNGVKLCTKNEWLEYAG